MQLKIKSFFLVVVAVVFFNAYGSQIILKAKGKKIEKNYENTQVELKIALEKSQDENVKKAKIVLKKAEKFHAAFMSSNDYLYIPSSHISDSHYHELLGLSLNIKNAREK